MRILLVKKNKEIHTIEQYIQEQTGIPFDEFQFDERPYIHNLTNAVEMIKSHVGPVRIIGDYDCDGIMSSYILWKGFKMYGIDASVRVPLRFSEGYGLSVEIVEETNRWLLEQLDDLEDGLIVTCDNGIAALEAIRVAKKKGIKVIVTDHHLPVTIDNTVVLPEADVIVDPNADVQSTYKNYCGAGICYRLIEELLPNADLRELLVCASIATVADIVDIVGANHELVKQGLFYINRGIAPVAIKKIIELMELNHITEEDYGFKIGPVFNAASRLADNGANKVINILKMPMCEELVLSCRNLVERNEERKKITKDAMQLAEPMISERPIVLLLPDMYDDKNNLINLEGIIGLVAGKTCEKYKCPSVVFTKMPDGNLKGSARSISYVHLKQVLDKVNENGYILKYGGHSGAAGLTIDGTMFESFRASFIESCGEILPLTDDIEYDIDIQVSDIPFLKQKLAKYAPFGEGMRAPRFCIRVDLRQVNEIFMGKNGEHLKLVCPGVDLLAFNEADTYRRCLSKNTLYGVGKLSESWYKGVMSNQILLESFEVC